MAGDAAFRRRLDREVGRTRAILVESVEGESAATGRTEQFMPARLSGPAEPGAIVRARVTGHDGRQLIAEAR